MIKSVLKLCKLFLLTISFTVLFASYSNATISYLEDKMLEADKLSPNFTAEALKSKNKECKKMKPAKTVKAPSGHGIVPDAVVNNIYLTTVRADATVRNFLILGNAVMCYAGHFGAKDIKIAGWPIAKVPHVSLAISGLMIWILGVMLSMIIAYYLVDVSFKLGFAMLAMPIGIALWPFPPTRGYLFKIINIIFHSAGVFIFLCLGISYAMILFIAATESSDLETLYSYINEGKTEEAANVFSLGTKRFLLVLFAGVYGFRLVGESVNKYVKKFFPSTLGDLNPMHHRLAQATDFAKKKVGKVSGYATDVAKTQLGRGAAKIGGALGTGVAAVGAGMQRVGFKYTGGLIKAIGGAGRKMADNHEKDYQNQNKKNDKGDKSPDNPNGGNGDGNGDKQ